jgi:hypothetical protein
MRDVICGHPSCREAFLESIAHTLAIEFPQPFDGLNSLLPSNVTASLSSSTKARCFCARFDAFALPGPPPCEGSGPGLFRVGRATRSGPTGSCIGRYPGRTTRRDRPPERLRFRPLAGGHSVSKELLTSDAVSKPASPQKAITRLPRAGGSLPRLATGRWRPPDPVLRRTRGGRPAPDPLTHRSRLSELTMHHRPSCVVMAQRDERAALPDHTAPAIGQYARAQIGSRASSLGDRHRRLAGEILTQLGILRGARQTGRHCPPASSSTSEAAKRSLSPTTRSSTDAALGS